LIFWFTEEAIAAWRAAPRITPGGQARYSDLAVETALMLRAVVLKQMLDLGRPESVRGSWRSGSRRSTLLSRLPAPERRMPRAAEGSGHEELDPPSLRMMVGANDPQAAVADRVGQDRARRSEEANLPPDVLPSGVLEQVSGNVTGI
jgi:hypothetical protein